ncbi:hypothetical protein LOY42_20115 [Pseudomonas sp. B21-023]|uniref:hypothetical protein n=1 Tax=unclassified Pseudomonas TaxID=196821 RepID=UPI00111B49E9|nr:MULTISPECIES: hypothetical protein [unclassified Pseudomonas]MBI6953139.1 hypothetical protein [Pseudomonas sp. CCOS 191]UVL18191.1 hypothetical protein LOY44_19665 [Pseudomonas sp. B21-044]UVM15555.1 hypothetical protein LOY42_20115 [Pseudomonas sp. B21-023]
MKISHKADHRTLRAAEYPSLADQLDALWHAMHRGQLPAAEPFYSDVKRVKDKYPKSPRHQHSTEQP